MADNNEILKEFVEVTGVGNEEATFYLESANYDLGEAFNVFFQAQPEMRRPLVIPDEDSDDDVALPKMESPHVPPTNIATLSTLKKDSSSDEDEGQHFYAGGSVHSGQEVVGPPGPGRQDVIADLFRSARHLGAAEPPAHGSGSSTFQGAGYRLGQTSDDSVVVGSRVRKRHEVTLRLWKDGFSVDDGPLRSYSAPQDKEFLDQIKSGEIPAELLKGLTDESIHLNMESHRHENYSPSRGNPNAFVGSGHVLGSVTPNVTSGESREDVTPTEPKPKPKPNAPNIDKEKPITNIQVRLPDGSRFQAELNHNHTIGELRSYVISAHPQYSNDNVTFLTTFPSKELSDDSQTLAEAGLLNAAILMRVKK